MPAPDCPYAAIGLECNSRCARCSLSASKRCPPSFKSYPPFFSTFFAHNPSRASIVAALKNWCDPPAMRPGDLPIPFTDLQYPLFEEEDDEEQATKQNERAFSEAGNDSSGEEEYTEPERTCPDSDDADSDHDNNDDQTESTSNGNQKEDFSTVDENKTREEHTRGKDQEEPEEEEEEGEENEENEEDSGTEQDDDGDKDYSPHTGSKSIQREGVSTEIIPPTARPLYSCPLCDLLDEVDELIGCDGHDAWYHLHCVGLDSAPEGDWYCLECTPSSSRQPNVQQAQKTEKRHTAPKRPRPNKKKSRSQPAESADNTDEEGKGEKKEEKKKKWTDPERDLLIPVMEEVLAEKIPGVYDADYKYEVVANRLKARHGVDRTAHGVKGQWARVLRLRTGIDERRKKKPEKLVTCVTTPDKRREQRKRKAGAQGWEGSKVAAKRQKTSSSSRAR